MNHIGSCFHASTPGAKHVATAGIRPLSGLFAKRTRGANPMIIEPKIRGFICTTAHPTGCATNVQRQIDHVVIKETILSYRKRVLVLGCSTGYLLHSRIVTTFGFGADTVGVSFEREPGETKPASAGWYNNRAFENRARAAGSKAVTVEGDAFSDEVKAQTIEAIRETLGQVDLIVYSLASPVRTDP